MNRRSSWRLMIGAAFAFALGVGACAHEDEQRGDGDATTPAAVSPGLPTHGLVNAPGYRLIVQKCVLCHSTQQFLQQRGDREMWLGIIRWMQSDHGMWPLDPRDEDRIVEYLARHYAPERAGRRPPLRQELMPPNPFADGK